MTTEWFRNTTWDLAVEAAFDQKLSRARRKAQYLRIQACTIARSHPEVALRLLDRYFQLPDNFDHAQAHADRATALLALGRTNEAIASYEAALAREATFPKLRTQAYMELPYLIATCGIREQYDRALQLLQASEARLMFPVDLFRRHAAQALISADQGDLTQAKVHADLALRASERDHSGFRYHPTVGLVTGHYDEVISKLRMFSAA